MNHTVKPLSNWDSSPRHWAGKEEVQFPIQEIEPGKTFCSHYQNRILFDFVAHEARALTCNGWMWCQCTSCKVFRLDQWDRVAKTIFSVWKKKNEGVQNVAATTCLSLCLSPRKSCPFRDPVASVRATSDSEQRHKPLSQQVSPCKTC